MLDYGAVALSNDFIAHISSAGYLLTLSSPAVRLRYLRIPALGT